MARCQIGRCDRDALPGHHRCVLHHGSSKHLTALEKVRLLPRPTRQIPGVRRASLEDAIAYVQSREDD